MGGGLDDATAFVQQAQWGGGGNFMILRTDDDNLYNDWVYRDIKGVQSAATVVIESRQGTYDPFVLQVLRNASAVFVAGGDQWEYFQFWRSNPVGEFLRQAVGRIPLGGTSAGCMILSPEVFDAMYDTVTSEEALANPFDRRVTISPGFVNVSILPNRSLLDTHFQQRDRFGRLLVFVARMLVAYAAPVYGIGISQHSAFTVSPSGEATLQGNPCSDSPSAASSASTSSSSASGGTSICGTAYILYGMEPVQLTPGEPLTMAPIRVQRLNAGDTFDFKTIVM
jgi:hypothetical protein